MTKHARERAAPAPRTPSAPATPANPPRRGRDADDTIRLPRHAGDPADDTVVRPALAVLFRIAVGPSADRYVRRFLAYERRGRGGIGWHWASFLAPPVWAFYRRLWVPGVLFAMLPLAGAAAFGAIAPAHAGATWIACAALAVWLVPSALPALVADSLLYASVRRQVRRAEGAGRSPAGAARELSSSPPTSALAAVLLGGGVTLLVLSSLVPSLAASYATLDVRERLAAALAAVHGLTDDIEATWGSARLLPAQTQHPAVRAQAQAATLDDVDVSPLTGRVRVALGPALRELWGKTLILAPQRDGGNRVRWLCIPIDIPARYLPRECLD